MTDENAAAANETKVLQPVNQTHGALFSISFCYFLKNIVAHLGC